MKKTIISMALLVLIVAPAAVAQSDKGTSVGTTINGAVPQALRSAIVSRGPATCRTRPATC
jgi:hypothetical protein